MTQLLKPYVNQATAQNGDSGNIDLFTGFISDAQVEECTVVGLPTGITVNASLVTQGTAIAEDKTYLVTVIVVSGGTTQQYYLTWVIGSGSTLSNMGSGNGGGRNAISKSIYG